MADDDAQQEPIKPYPGLRQLDRLVGTWEISGPDVKGTSTYEWMEGGFFLVQKVDLEQWGQKTKGIEIIGYERGFGETEPSEDITSRFFDNQGNTLWYTYEISDDTLTVWGGPKGSPAKYEGKFSDNGDTNTGAWEWPGGGYESTMTRVK